MNYDRFDALSPILALSIDSWKESDGILLISIEEFVFSAAASIFSPEIYEL